MDRLITVLHSVALVAVGMWLVVAVAAGLAALILFFAGRIQSLKVLARGIAAETRA